MSLTTNLTIISLLGGPASGKGTQSTHLTTHFPTKRIHHISIGDMPREEMQDSASPYASLLQENMLAGRLGPPDMTVRILKRNLERVESGTVVVLDGFPRAIMPYRLFEEIVAPIRRIVGLEVPEEVLVRRLEKRARSDDVAGAANIAERMRTYRENTAEVLKAAKAEGKVVRVDGDRDVESVADDVRATLRDILGEEEKA